MRSLYQYVSFLTISSHFSPTVNQTAHSALLAPFSTSHVGTSSTVIASFLTSLLPPNDD